MSKFDCAFKIMANKQKSQQLTITGITSEPTVQSVFSSTVASKKIKKRKSSCSWRVAMLATPKYVRQKYQETGLKQQENLCSGVRKEALKGNINERVEHMARPNLRSLYINKRSYSGNPNTFKDFDARMDKHINNAWNSIYNEYKKAKRDESLQTKHQQRIIDEEFKKNQNCSRSTTPVKELLPKKGKVDTKTKVQKSGKVGKAKSRNKQEEKTSKKSKESEKGSQKLGGSKKPIIKKIIHPVKINSNMNILYKYEF